MTGPDGPEHCSPQGPLVGLYTFSLVALTCWDKVQRESHRLLHSSSHVPVSSPECPGSLRVPSAEQRSSQPGRQQREGAASPRHHPGSHWVGHTATHTTVPFYRKSTRWQQVKKMWQKWMFRPAQLTVGTDAGRSLRQKYKCRKINRLLYTHTLIENLLKPSGRVPETINEAK